MKKTIAGNRGSTTKRRAVPKSVDEYLAGVPEPGRGTLNRIRKMILAAVPTDATEVISYRIPMIKHKGRPLLGFAAFTNHCSLFGMSGTLLENFPDELKNLDISKGTIRFPMNKPLPAAFVKKLVQARFAELGLR